jgi:hypothetical protein
MTSKYTLFVGATAKIKKDLALGGDYFMDVNRLMVRFKGKSAEILSVREFETRDILAFRLDLPSTGYLYYYSEDMIEYIILNNEIKQGMLL